MPPPFSRSGASRVQRITDSPSGSPEATPSVNGLPGSDGGVVVVLDVEMADAGVPAPAAVVGCGGVVVSLLLPPLQAPRTTAAPPARNRRREIGGTGAIVHGRHADQGTRAKRA